MKKNLVFQILIFAFALMFSINISCSASEKTAPDSKKPAEVSEKAQEMKIPQNDPVLSGKVVETMNTGGYTYVNIGKDGKEIWVAVPEMKISVGEEISFRPGMPMNNFKSKTLNRTFETIVFSAGVMGKQAEKPDTTTVDKKSVTLPDTKEINIKKAAGPDAYKVAELYEKSAELDKKNVTVSGQVVKFSAAIMGKNWIHLQDGSGDPLKGTNDILATSQDVVAVGDIITINGTLAKDKDFGSGYKYSLVIEQSTVKK